MRWGAGIAALAILASCGGAQVPAETARAAACQALEAQIETRHAAGHMTDDEAFARIDCVRLTCDAIRDRIVDEEEAENGD